MAERVLRGTPASPGAGLGAAWVRAEEPADCRLVPAEERERERDTALAALAAAAEALEGVAARLPEDEAEIVAAGVLMARDPALARAVEDAVFGDGLAAGQALTRATDEHADAIAALGDEALAARADDVRSLGRRAARLTTKGATERPPGAGTILIAHDLGPADIAELAPLLAGVALAAGSPTAHASIVGRSLGIPMVTGLGPRVLEATDGAPLALDGSAGTVIMDPSPGRARAVSGAMRAQRRADERAHAEREQPAVTDDGTRVVVLANVAALEELRVGLRAGAEGIGLLRTELAFLNAPDWPSERDHIEALTPILDGVGDRRAVVRVLDFGADKSPPFLAGRAERGLELLLRHRDALIAQLRAIVRLSFGARDVRVLLPMVESPDQVIAVRRLLGALGPPLPLGAMIETASAARHAAAIAAHCDFLSIGTNDLTASTLGVDRFAGGAPRAHHPEVLRLIARTVDAAQRAGTTIEICGESASDRRMLPLLVGLGVDEVSVGAARVGAVRAWIRRLRAEDAARAARAALALDTAEEVERAVSALAEELESDNAGSVQAGNGRRERIERGAGVRAFGA